MLTCPSVIAPVRICSCRIVSMPRLSSQAMSSAVIPWDATHIIMPAFKEALAAVTPSLHTHTQKQCRQKPICATLEQPCRTHLKESPRWRRTSSRLA